MSELKIKGIWLSKEILDIPEISIKEKMILALSINLYKSNKKCFVSNKVQKNSRKIDNREIIPIVEKFEENVKNL